MDAFRELKIALGLWGETDYVQARIEARILVADEPEAKASRGSARNKEGQKIGAKARSKRQVDNYRYRHNYSYRQQVAQKTTGCAINRFAIPFITSPIEPAQVDGSGADIFGWMMIRKARLR